MTGALATLPPFLGLPELATAVEEGHNDIGVPAVVWGVGAFGLLVLLLLITLMLGKGRPHS